MKRRILSIITALALCLSLCPTWALAAEADPSLCKHHPEHTTDCGYAAPTEGHPCGHQHTAECYTLGVLPDGDSGDPYGIGGDTENRLDCHHSHDSECGYVQADPGTPCGYECRICPIEALIAALPDKVTEDNAEDVRAQLEEILALYGELNEDEQGQIDLSLCYELQEALDNANAPMQAAEEINISENLNNILTAEAGGCPGHTFTGTTANAARIYVKSGAHDVTFSNLNITKSPEVGIAPGATMNLTIEGANTIKSSEAGIYVPVGATLIINGTGSLNVSGSRGGAGIGGAVYVPDGSDSDGDPNCGTVEINGGTITATGGSMAAGIGGGGYDSNPGNGGNVTINGGTVTATGGSDGYYGGAGIGGGGYDGASKNGGTLTINGGHVTLAPGTHDPQYPAYGFGRGSSENTSGVTCELTLADESYLTVDSLDPNGKYTINGDPTEDMIVVPTDLVYNGQAQDLTGKIYIDDSKTGTGTYFGQTFTVKANAEGWTYTINPSEVKAAGEYTVTFSKEGHTSISKTFTVAQSGTDLTEGKVKTYNGETETTTFTASDTITVKATPTATGAAPTNSAMFAASFTAPGSGQMAVFVNDTQVSEPVGAGDGGTYTMTVSASDVLIYGQEGENGKYTLIAKFVGNTNMADAHASVEVTVTPNPLTADMVTMSAESGTYNGTEQKPTITVTGLTEGTDYEVTFQDGFKNAGTYTLTVTGKGVYRGTVEKTYTIGKATPTIEWNPMDVELTYTGRPADIQPVITLVNGETFNGTITYTYGEYSGPDRPTNAGGYTVQASIPEQGNYLAAKSGWMILYIDKANQAAPAAPTAEDANIKDTSITLTTIANAEYSEGGTTWQDSPTFTGLNPNTAYTFYARLKGDDNHNPSSASAGTSITTKKMMLDNATVTVSGTYIYNGAAQTPAVTVVKDGKTLTEGTDYTVAYANNTNAGTATVTITGMGDYEGTNSTTFTIQRKTLTVAGAIAAGRPYNGTNTVTITGVTLEGVVNGDTVSVSTSGLTGTLNGADAGDYTAVTLPTLTLTGAAEGNYTLTRPTGAVSTSVTISKAATGELDLKDGDLAVANGREHIYTYGLGALRPEVPEGMSLGSAPVTYTLGDIELGSYYTGGAKIDGQTLTLPIQKVDSEDVKEIGTVTVIIHTGNFEDITATIKVRSVNKIVPEGAPTLSTDTLTYGQALSAITLSGSMKDGETDVPGVFAWSSSENRPAVQDSYAAAWVFTPADNDTYAIVTGTATIKVVPASIANAEITLSETAYRYDGGSHSPSVTSVKLDGATLTEGTDYTTGIQTGTEAGTYTVTVTGKGNYTGTATAAFTINPVEASDEFKDESGTVLRLEVEIGLSTVPEALTGNEKYNTPEKIETALRAAVTEVMSNAGENIAVFDVTLQYKDENGVWRDVDPNDFPANGVTAILPYPAGTGMTGYTFTVQHLISSGGEAGTMETLTYELTADGLKCKFNSLSPVAIGYQAASKPVDPVTPSPTTPSYPTGGGWSGVSTYAVTIEKSEHGKVTSNRTNASSGSTVTLTVTPDSGYVLDTLTVTDSRGSVLQLTAQGDGKYTFTMPSRAVTVKATFAPLPDDVEKPCDGGADCPSRGFTDLGSVGTWYHEAVDYVIRNGLMNGYSNGTFGPNDYLSRAMLAQILFNKEGRPVVNYLLQYSDVAAGAWYTEAVRWATSQGIVNGYGNGMFGPNDNITREQLAVMLWRYAGSPAATDKELHFTDADKASGYALEALRWAAENGVLNGYGDGRLDPKGLATRAQVAQMLKNFLKDE